MSYKIGYFIKDQGQGIENTVWFTVADNLKDADYLAEEAVAYVWHYKDGWEWIRDGVVFTLVKKGTYDDSKEEPSIVGDFEITLEHMPVFYANEVK